jgi:hypothetical protein
LAKNESWAGEFIGTDPGSTVNEAGQVNDGG